MQAGEILLQDGEVGLQAADVELAHRGARQLAGHTDVKRGPMRGQLWLNFTVLRIIRVLIRRCRSSVSKRDHRPCPLSDRQWSRDLHEAHPITRSRQKPVKPELGELQIKTLACPHALNARPKQLCKLLH